MKKMKKIKLKFEGGFHNSKPIVIMVPIYFFANNRYPHYLSAGQKKKLDKHFCGINGCACGGASRASIDTLNYKLMPV